jgi:FkbM family methyltransferase
MSSRIKALLKQTIAATGFELKRTASSNSEEACAGRLMTRTSPDLIIDVGANEGQYGLKIMQSMPQARLISFEPLPKAHKKLSEEARRYAQWTVGERCAIGSFEGETEINVAENSVSSSILPIGTRHVQASPPSHYVARERVPIRRLDAIIPQYLSNGRRAYLKADAQGYERQVLEGAEGIMHNLAALQLEISFAELYQGQTLAFEMIDIVRQRGFRLFALSNTFSDPTTGELLQADAFFISQSHRD